MKLPLRPSTLRIFSLVCFMFAAVMCITGCNAPEWIQDAQNLVPIIGASIGAVLSLLASMNSNPAIKEALNKVSTIVTATGEALGTLQTLISQYQDKPTDTTLEKVRKVADDISKNLTQLVADLGGFGLPPALGSKIEAWARLALSQIEAWVAVLPSIHVMVKANSVQHLDALRPAGDKLLPSAELKARFNQILDEGTDDPEVNKVLATLPRV